MAATAATSSRVRISLIAGRYLVFDPEAISTLRRKYNTNGTLVGTLPQQPTQNLFLGGPIEIRPEEAEALVARGAARVVDDAAAHRAALNSSTGRAAYIEDLRRKKAAAQKLITERTAEKIAASADKYGQAGGTGQKSKRKAKQAADAAPTTAPPQDTDGLLFGGDEPQKAKQEKGSTSIPEKAVAAAENLAVTPTYSEALISDAVDKEYEVSQIREGPLARFLQNEGFHMTPGLRFGSKYSVYRGDPLRFHAHFMANQYDWNEPIPILELVEGGRLATAVKKSFLVGGEDPSTGEVKTFSIEWASM